MFKNYLIVGLRNIRRQKVYSFINIFGLAVGMMCCLLALLFVQDEFSFDRFHEKGDRIYRVMRSTRVTESDVRWDHRTSGPLGDVLAEYSEVANVVRFMRRGGTQVTHATQVFEQNFCVADASVFGVFDFPLLQGDAETVLREVASVVLTKKMAERFFGDENPIGKVISVSDPYFKGDFTVTGVMADLPRHSTIRFDCLATPATQYGVNHRWTKWFRSGYRYVETYVLLQEGASVLGFEAQMQDIMTQYMGVEIGDRDAYGLQPLADQYWHF